MKGWLLDTNILSELRKPQPAIRVSQFVRAQPAESLFISDVTSAEILFGIERISDPVRRSELLAWLDRTVRPVFAGRVLPVSEDVLVRWKHMVLAGQKRRHTFSQPDLFIAAQAALRGLIVVSRDVSQFVAADVPVLDPWTGTFHPAGKSPVAIAEVPTLPGLIKAGNCSKPTNPLQPS